MKNGALKPSFLKGHVRGTLIFKGSNFEFSEKPNVISLKKGSSNRDGRTAGRPEQLIPYELIVQVHMRTNDFLTFLREHIVKPMVFHVFRVLDQTRPP